MTTTVTETTKVTLDDIRNAFINEWNKMNRFYQDMRRFKTAEDYADSELSLVKICFELRDEKYFLAFENSLRPHSVQWSDFEFVDRFYGRNLKVLKDSKPEKDRKNKKRLKEYTAHPLNEKENKRRNELLEMGHGGYGFKKEGRTDEQIRQDNIQHARFEQRLYEISRINDLEQKLNLGKHLLCEIVTS